MTITRRQKSISLPRISGDCESANVAIMRRSESWIVFENMQRNQFDCGQSSSIVMVMMMMTIMRCNRLSSNYVVAWKPFDALIAIFIHSIRCVRVLCDVRVNKWNKSEKNSAKSQHSRFFLLILIDFECGKKDVTWQQQLAAKKECNFVGCVETN